MTEVLLNSLVPIFAVMALGYFAGWVRDIDNRHVAELNALVMDFALPAALFVATASTPRSLLLAQWPLLLVFLLSMLILYVLSFWMQRHLFRLGQSEAAVQALTIAAPNYAAAGLALIAAVFSEADTIYVALAIATGSIVLSPLALAILEANTVSGKSPMRMGGMLRGIGCSLRKPIVFAPLTGVAFSLLGIPLVEPLKDSFQLIGKSAGGVALFLTGLILSAQTINLNANVLSGTVLKNIVHPLLAFGLILILPIDHQTARAAILLCALPCGFFGTLFSLRYRLESHLPGSTLIVSSLASIVTLPIVLVLTEGW